MRANKPTEAILLVRLDSYAEAKQASEPQISRRVE